MTTSLSPAQFGDSPFGQNDTSLTSGWRERALIKQLDEQDDDYDLQQQLRRGHMTQAWRLG